jgi:hypothetical protein
MVILVTRSYHETLMNGHVVRIGQGSGDPSGSGVLSGQRLDRVESRDPSADGLSGKGEVVDAMAQGARGLAIVLRPS